MNEPKRACLEPAEFTEFLNDQLTEDEEVAAQKHLVECEKCQAELESLVTCGHGWEELRSSLTDISGSFGRQVDESDVPLDAQANWSAMLAPTDEPNSLGRLGRYEVLSAESNPLKTTPVPPWPTTP